MLGFCNVVCVQPTCNRRGQLDYSECYSAGTVQPKPRLQPKLVAICCFGSQFQPVDYRVHTAGGLCSTSRCGLVGQGGWVQITSNDILLFCPGVSVWSTPALSCCSWHAGACFSFAVDQHSCSGVAEWGKDNVHQRLCHLQLIVLWSSCSSDRGVCT